MTMPDLTVDLTSKLLLAMPGMTDPRFAGTVIFLCSHSPNESMGLVINKPVNELTFSELIEQLDINVDAPVPNLPIGFGGPVEIRRGFVLHSSDYAPKGERALKVDHRFSMTASMTVLEDLALGNGPKEAFLALGYAGWGAGQLEQEILRNDWLTAEADPELVFALSMENKWEAALASLGIDPVLLSSEAGHA